MLDAHITNTQKAALVIIGLRNIFGLSQTEMAKVAGVSRPTIARLEKFNGVENFRTDTIDSILRVFDLLGVRVEYIESGFVIRVPTHAAIQAIAKRTKDQRAFYAPDGTTVFVSDSPE